MSTSGVCASRGWGGPTTHPAAEQGRRAASSLPLKPDPLLTPARPAPPRALKISCESLLGLAPIPPAALPVPQFPSFARVLPWVGCPQSGDTKGPRRPQEHGNGCGVETSAAASPCCASARDQCLGVGERGRILLPQRSAKLGEQFVSSPCRHPLERCRAGGWKAGSCGPCPPTRHGKSGGKLRFQETAAPTAKKHKSEQSPAILGLETFCLRPRASCGGCGDCVTAGLPASCAELSPGAAGKAPPRTPPPNYRGVRAGVTPAGSCQLTGTLARAVHGREFLWQGFWRFSIYFCADLGTNSPIPAFAGKERASGDSFQLDGARLFPQCFDSSFASFGGNTSLKSEGRSGWGAKRQSSPSPHAAVGRAASERFLHHFRPPNQTFLARGWGGSLAQMEAADGKWLQSSPACSDSPSSPPPPVTAQTHRIGGCPPPVPPTLEHAASPRLSPGLRSLTAYGVSMSNKSC